MILSAEAIRLGRTISDNRLYLLLADTRKEAYYLASDLDNFYSEDSLYFFPATSEKSEYKKATAQLQRTATLAAVSSYTGEKPVLIVTYTGAIEEKVLKSKEIKSSILHLSKGQKITHDEIGSTLQSNGFVKADFVTVPGEYALRGSIVDIYSFADENPFRIDFFGNEIDSIRVFDVNTQLSIEELDKISIYPDLDTNHSESDYVPFKEILPANTVIKDYRLVSGEEGREDLNVSPQPVFGKNFELLAKDIAEKTMEGYKVKILSPNDAQRRRLSEILRQYPLARLPEFVNMSLHEGYVDHNEKICYYTDHQIFERYHKIKVNRQVERSEQMTVAQLNALQIGDYVVHIDHGVGQYGGLVKTNMQGRTQEAVKIIYKDGDVIFVSIHSLHRIARYKSKDGIPPKIYKLGSKVWDNLKQNVKSKVKDIAKDLIKLYAERQQSEGFAFSPDSYLQQELESSFLFEDTPDQTKATEAVKADMESDHPMDRLICGDVGFGKTEIAVRAAFKAVTDSKQVAVLVPTTILALQHYQTFSERLKNFPCRVEYISRLRTAKEIKQIEQDLADGKIDILIGTHKILGKSVRFRDLGLLIIDEEQKFGVQAKEKIRIIKNSIDTLTLTATPIPRTLQFSLLGARDMSVIQTPPPNRLPVSTEIITFDREYIAEIIQREIERGGQVYFVHNRIEDISKIENILHQICPQAEICTAHGQMEPQVLEKKILDFIEGDYDILLSTTIVENGIDIPNANTMIINNAQRFGLGDLHQLRGRVGRSNMKAFCYLVVPDPAALTEDARRRVKALEAFSDLGSGFSIAMQDLDIRGAGNLLGAQQSGFMAEMGFETYMRILKEAMQEINEKEAPQVGSEPFVDTFVETDLEILIPDSYVNVPSEKIRLYRELDAITSEEQIRTFITRIADRFGSPVPVPVLELVDIVRLRLVAGRLGIKRVVLKNNTMLAFFIDDRKSWFFKSELFGSLLQQISALQIFNLCESSGKLYLKAKDITSVSKALTALNRFLV